jgi:hypothetical protein
MLVSKILQFRRTSREDEVEEMEDDRFAFDSKVGK